MIEMLQMLKFGFKQERLSSTHGWVLTAEEILEAEKCEDYEDQ